MTEVQKVDTEKAQALLEELWGKPAVCPFSGHTDWSMAEYIVEVRPFLRGGLDLEKGAYPGVLVACEGCGYMVMFSAVRLGLVSEVEEEEAKEAEPQEDETESEVSNAER